jgi:aryl-alcohol dehydrogenase-like predicted oxidoreductase
MPLADTIEVAGQSVPRLGFGTMRLTGPQIFGEPVDRAECVRVVRAAYTAGIRLFDTAWYYGPDVASAIVKEALYPYPDDVLFVSKLGGARTSDGGWMSATSPDEIRRGAERECRLLGIDRLPVVHLRWMPGGDADLDRMLATFLELREEGLLDGIGLSTVTVEQLDHVVDAGVAVATVSNPYGPGARDEEPVLRRCEELGIPFLPYFSILTSQGGDALGAVAKEIGATPQQVAIAWQLQRSPVVVAIPGTSKVAHLEQNVAAANLTLSDEQLAQIG